MKPMYTVVKKNVLTDWIFNLMALERKPIGYVSQYPTFIKTGKSVRLELTRRRRRRDLSLL